jgi:hypothetical protein
MNSAMASMGAKPVALHASPPMASETLDS